MREIKFRAWDAHTKEMITYAEHLTGDLLIQYCDMPIMQYTGLKDKNGKEIYEGDIVWNSPDRGNVFWHDLHCQFQIDNSLTDCFLMPNDEWYKYEVIGNIYENEDLLNKGV